MRWCWWEHGSETAQGPFDTEDEARKDAAEYEDGAEIKVGHAVYPDPGDYVAAWFDDLLELMDQEACDDDFYSGDEPLFEAAVGAQAALQEWARKYIHVATFTSREP